MPKPPVNGGGLPRFWTGFAKASAFVAVFVTALPTYQQYLKSLTLHVPFQNVSQAENQEKLWAQNRDCFKQATPVQVKTNTNDQVSVTVCPSTGDLLLDVQLPGGRKPITRWIGLHEFETTWSAIAAATAWAAESPAPFEIAQVPTAVLCQKPLGPGIILRRVQYANGQCADQQINTYTGAVTSVTPAACTPNC